MKKPDQLTKKFLQRTLSTQARKVNNRLPPLNLDKLKNKASGYVNCHDCVHFFVTWEKRTPNGCRAHGFKTAQIPSQVVFSSSGKPCLLYLKKD
jgi:hypothetical protein